MKKSYLPVIMGMALASATLLSGCAVMEEIAQNAENRFAYSEEVNRIRTQGWAEKDFETIYKKYEREQDAYKKNNPKQVITDTTILPYMAYLDLAAHRACEIENINHRPRLNIPKFQNTEEAKRSFDKIIAENNNAIKLLQRRLAIVNEAEANFKHMYIISSYDKKDIERQIKILKRTKNNIEESKSSILAQVEKREKEQRDKESAEKALAENLKNPAFLYPKTNICNSSVTLLQDFKSGMNSLMLKKEFYNNPSNDGIRELEVDGRKYNFFGGHYLKTDFMNIGSLGIYYARESETPKNTGVLFCARMFLENAKTIDDLIVKYKKEMPNAVVTKKAVEKNKQTYLNYFTRYEIHHYVTFKQGAKVVSIVRAENKTTFTNSWKRYSPQFKMRELKRYAEGITKRKNLSNKYIKNFYNCEYYAGSITIYDENQLNAYSKIYSQYKQNQTKEKAKKRQQQLNF